MISVVRLLTLILYIFGSFSSVLTQEVDNNNHNEDIVSNNVADTSQNADTIIDSPDLDKEKSADVKEGESEQTLQATTDDVESKSNASEPVKHYYSMPSNPRLITKEELAAKNGEGEDKTLWISILSEVFDVSSAPNFYAKGSTYNIFVGRDANVPFVTGEFNVEEASKSISTLDQHDLWVLAHFFNETYKQEEGFKYPFVGLLIGELYTEKGEPTPLLRELREKIAVEDVKKKAEERYYEELAKERNKELKEQEEAEKAKKNKKKRKIRPIRFIRKHYRRARKFIKKFIEKIITKIQERFKDEDVKANEEMLKNMLQGLGQNQVPVEL